MNIEDVSNHTNDSTKITNLQVTFNWQQLRINIQQVPPLIDPDYKKDNKPTE